MVFKVAAGSIEGRKISAVLPVLCPILAVSFRSSVEAAALLPMHANTTIDIDKIAGQNCPQQRLKQTADRISRTFTKCSVIPKTVHKGSHTWADFS